jgi:hypothetical protein
MTLKLLVRYKSFHTHWNLNINKSLYIKVSSVLLWVLMYFRIIKKSFLYDVTRGHINTPLYWGNTYQSVNALLMTSYWSYGDKTWLFLLSGYDRLYTHYTCIFVIHYNDHLWRKPSKVNASVNKLEPFLGIKYFWKYFWTKPFVMVFVINWS